MRNSQLKSSSQVVVKSSRNKVIDAVNESKLRLDLHVRNSSGGLLLDYGRVAEYRWWVITGFEDELQLGNRLQPIAVESRAVLTKVREYEKYQKLTVVYGYPCSTVDHSTAVCAIVEGMQLLDLGSAAAVYSTAPVFTPSGRATAFNPTHQPLRGFKSGAC